MTFLWIAVITFGILQMTSLCTTVYLHRGLTHRGLQLHPAVAFLMHLHLRLFTGIVPQQWVAVHRKHHHFSDREGDPHSPYVYGMWKVLFLNYWYYKREANNAATLTKYTPDYKPDLIDKVPIGGFGWIGGMGIFMLMFGWGWGAAAWAAHAVAYIFSSAAINSVCHGIGYRNFDNQATNLTPVAWLTTGEGLHNNHHEFPTSARFSVKRGEFDPAWPVIKLLEKLGLATVKSLPVAVKAA